MPSENENLDKNKMIINAKDAINSETEQTNAFLSLFSKFEALAQAEIKVKEFELQTKQLDIGLQTQQDNHSFEFSSNIAELQFKDKAEDRIAKSKEKRMIIYLTFTTFIILFGSFIYLTTIGKEQILVEVFKAIGYGGGGGIIGAAYMIIKNTRKFLNQNTKK